MNGQYVSRKELLQVIDDHWMLEDPDHNEYAFLFRLIQERHRTQFEQTFQQSTPEPYEAVQRHLRTIDQERNRAEEILYWLYLDNELRQQRRTFPDQVEAKNKRGDQSV